MPLCLPGYFITKTSLLGFKMVKLATPALSLQVPEKDTLRSLGLWYPDIPGPTLSLNESSFLPRSHVLYGYKLLFWTTFGGPGGGTSSN